MRGQVYDIQGKTFFTMGGASSHDIQDGILEPDDPLFNYKWSNSQYAQKPTDFVFLSETKALNIGPHVSNTQTYLCSFQICSFIVFKKKCRQLDARGAMYRVNHLSWWKEELPSEEEYQTTRTNLDRVGWAVDYINHPLLPLQCAGRIQRRILPERCFDRVERPYPIWTNCCQLFGTGRVVLCL